MVNFCNDTLRKLNKNFGLNIVKVTSLLPKDYLMVHVWKFRKNLGVSMNENTDARQFDVIGVRRNDYKMIYARLLSLDVRRRCGAEWEVLQKLVKLLQCKQVSCKLAQLLYSKLNDKKGGLVCKGKITILREMEILKHFM